MPNLSASNRSQLSYKLEGVYPTGFGNVIAGDGTLINMTSETLDYTVKTEQSKQLRDDRSVPDIVQVGASSAGGFGFEAQYQEYDAFIEGVMQNPFVSYGTNGVSTASAGTMTASSVAFTAAVATAGADNFTTLAKGQWFTVIPHVSATKAVKDYLKSRPFRVSLTTAPTTTVLTVDTATPINTTILSAALAAGWRVSSSRSVNGNVMKSYNLEVQHADVGQYRVYTGMIPSKMDMKLSVGSIVTGTFDFMGKSFELLQATTMGTATPAQTYTPANATKGVFDIIEGGASITATTYIKSADLSIDNSLRMQDAIGVFGAAGIAAGTMNITAKLEVYFANEIIYKKFLDNEATSMSIPILDVDGNGYIYTFPRMRYKSAKVNAGGLDQDNMLTMDGQALPDNVVGSPTYGKSVVVDRVGNPVSAPIIVSATNPRWGYGLANPTGDQTAFGSIFGAMNNLTGSATGGRAGTFATAVSTTQFTWLAVLASVAGSSITITDSANTTGGFSGALCNANNNQTGVGGPTAGNTETSPTTLHGTYTDGDGNVWNMYRSDSKASNSGTLTLS